MRYMTTNEHRSRRLFNYLMQASINEDGLNRPGAAGERVLSAMIEDLIVLAEKARRAGSKAPLGQGYDPMEYAVLTARIAAHAYAMARNEGVLNDFDLPQIADRLDA